MIYFLVTIISFSSCNKIKKQEIICSDRTCEGIYDGPEFIWRSDVAHQFSNEMCDSVGDKLKSLYKSGKYSKVDYSKILMSTEGMGSGNVVYKITIPLISVKEKCQAYTSFDHVGGWNHKPDSSERVAHLKSALNKNDTLNISQLLFTKEGLQEYWIQWRNKDIQSECAN
jgi:hypothetical protein